MRQFHIISTVRSVQFFTFSAATKLPYNVMRLPMNPRPSRNLIVSVLTLLTTGLAAIAWSQEGFRSFREVWGPRYQAAAHAPPLPSHPVHHGGNEADRVRHWNEIAITASGIDHTPVALDETRVFGEQFGPLRASRAMAIVHIAVFETVNAISGGVPT